MREQPLISVVIATFNYGAFIAETLESLRAQSYPHWEGFVIDDGSTDDTRDIVERIAATDPRIRYHCQANEGQAIARNQGIARSRGAYLQFLDADDLLQPRKLETHAAYLDANPLVDIAYGDARYFRADRPGELHYSMAHPDVDWMPRVSGPGRELAPLLVERNIMTISSPLLRADVIREVGPFDESMRRLEDWDLWIRCALAGKVFQYHAPDGTMALVRAHASSLTKSVQQHYEPLLHMRRKIERLTEDPRVLEINRAMTAQLCDWMDGITRVRETLAGVTNGSIVILVDEDQCRRELAGNNGVFLPFLERAGAYWGPPASDDDAVRELERLRTSGAAFLAFGWPAFWWLDHYGGFRAYVESRFKRLAANDRVILFDLRS